MRYVLNSAVHPLRLLRAFLDETGGMLGEEEDNKHEPS